MHQGRRLQASATFSTGPLIQTITTSALAVCDITHFWSDTLMKRRAAAPPHVGRSISRVLTYLAVNCIWTSCHSAFDREESARVACAAWRNALQHLLHYQLSQTQTLIIQRLALILVNSSVMRYVQFQFRIDNSVHLAKTVMTNFSPSRGITKRRVWLTLLAQLACSGQFGVSGARLTSTTLEYKVSDLGWRLFRQL